MLQNTLLKNKAFSLVETVISLGFIATISFLVVSFILTTGFIREKNMLKLTVLREGEYIEKYITTLVENGDTITTPASGTSSSLVVQTTNILFSSPVTLSVSGTYLNTTEGASLTTPLHSSRTRVTSFSVERFTAPINPTTLIISYTIDSTKKIGTESFIFSKTYTIPLAIRK